MNSRLLRLKDWLLLSRCFDLKLRSNSTQKLHKVIAPMTLKEVQSVLGILDFTRAFVPDFGQMIKPLYELIVVVQRRKPFWTLEAQATLDAAIEKITTSTALSSLKAHLAAGWLLAFQFFKTRERHNLFGFINCICFLRLSTNLTEKRNYWPRIC